MPEADPTGGNGAPGPATGQKKSRSWRLWRVKQGGVKQSGQEPLASIAGQASLEAEKVNAA